MTSPIRPRRSLSCGCSAWPTRAQRSPSRGSTRCYRGFWEEGIDLADAGALEHLAHEAGLDPAEAAGVLADGSRIAAVRRQALIHRRAGVGGVPTILAHRTLVRGLLDDATMRELAGL